jgi:hypothetical protein
VRPEFAGINIRRRVVPSRNLLALAVPRPRARQIWFLRVRSKQHFNFVGGVCGAIDAGQKNLI